MERWEGAVEDIFHFQVFKENKEKVNKLRKEASGQDLNNNVGVYMRNT